MELTEETMMQPQLPIAARRQDIMSAIESERVVIISGKTGCGKSTQVPQYIMGSDPNAKIAVCQPRRIAATSLAMRVSQQNRTKLGKQIGYHIGMENNCTEATKIVFMTYGILIQRLLHSQKIPYTHIILDEIHERSIEMDFTCVALKKILEENQENKIKLIVMSATINAQAFSQYFAMHRQKSVFLRPKLKFQQPEMERNRRGERNRARNRGDQVIPSLTVKREFSNREMYREARSIELQVKTPYKIQEFFIEQIFDPERAAQIRYYPNQDVRIDDSTFDMTVEIITGRLHTSGDVLVFVPGLQEIKKLKTLLITKGVEDPVNRIIQVHSAYSQDLTQKLFNSRVQNKIIIATNMGESSITLPECKVVIDFCLTRKNYSDKVTGYSKFETRLASKSSLCQRAGRVGRVSDGKVYRLIRKDLYQQLPQFDVPEIKCVSLEMIILKFKQIDSTYHKQLFEDPYDLLLNIMQPPELKDIEYAIRGLVHEDALNYAVPPQYEQKSVGTHYVGKYLKMTNIGKFMVSLPCQLRVSKMILYAIKLGIPMTMIDIASQFSCQKDFFAHQEKRENIQKFLSFLVQYDQNYCNDYFLRQRVFSDWRKRFYLPFKQKQLKRRNQKKNNSISNNQQKSQSKLVQKRNETSQQIKKIKFVEKTQEPEKQDIKSQSPKKQANNKIVYKEKQTQGVKPKKIKYVQKDQLEADRQAKEEQINKFEENKIESPKQTSLKSSQKEAILIFRDEQAYETNIIVQKFCKRDWGSQQRQWCLERAVYPTVMRQLLKISENLRSRLIEGGISLNQSSQKHVQNQLIILCLAAAFKQTDCRIKWDMQTKKNQSTQPFDYISFNYDAKQNCNLKDQILNYVDPESKMQLKVTNLFAEIYGDVSVLKKFILPRHLAKANLQKTTQFYKSIANTKVFYGYEPIVDNGHRTITVLNQSINKIILKRTHDSECLITNTIHESKGRYFVKSCAIIGEISFVLIQLLARKNIELIPHPSLQFFEAARIDGQERKLPCFIANKQIKEIIKFRNIFQRSKANSVSSAEQIMPVQQINSLLEFIRTVQPKRTEEPWENYYRTHVLGIQRINEKSYGINNLPRLQTPQQSYFGKYELWKKLSYDRLEKNYRLLTINSPQLICAQCYPSLIVALDDFKKFDFKRKLISFNEYSTNCAIKNQQAECRYGHKVGRLVDEDWMELFPASVKVYVPYNNVFEMDSTQQFARLIKQEAQKNYLEYSQIVKEVDCFECLICSTYEHGDEIRFEKMIEGKRFWQKVQKHMINKQHMKKSSEFMSSFQK